jgi:hypothetical protein
MTRAGSLVGLDTDCYFTDMRALGTLSRACNASLLPWQEIRENGPSDPKHHGKVTWACPSTPQRAE